MIRKMFLAIEEWINDDSFILEFVKFTFVFLTGAFLIIGPIIYFLDRNERKYTIACQEAGGTMTQTGVVRRRVYDPALKMVREKDVSLIECVLPE